MKNFTILECDFDNRLEEVEHLNLVFYIFGMNWGDIPMFSAYLSIRNSMDDIANYPKERDTHTESI